MVRISTLCWAVSPGFGLCHCCSDFVLQCEAQTASAWPNFELLCVPHSMFNSPFIEVFEFTFQTLPVLLSPCLRSPRSLVCQKSRCWEQCLWVGWFDPSGMWDQNQDKAGMLLSIHQSLAGYGCLFWCCLDESRSPQSQMVPFVFTILVHFCSFSLPSLHESASTRNEVSTSSLFSRISILPAMLDSRI